MSTIGSRAAAVEAAKQRIGEQIGDAREAVVDRSAIAMFVEAVHDENPLWRDEAYAATTRFGGVISPPTFVNHVIRRPIDVTQDRRPEAPFSLPLGSPVNAGVEYDFVSPRRPGDRVRAVTRLHSVEEREGKTGLIVLVKTETTYTDERGQVVARSRNAQMYR